MNKILRFDIDNDDTVSYTPDGCCVYYAAIQHAYKECLEHGLSLSQAIETIEQHNGS